MEILHKLWVDLGSPSWISAANLALFFKCLCYLVKHFKRINKLENELEGKLELLNEKFKSLDKLINTRINDLKDCINNIKE